MAVAGCPLIATAIEVATSLRYYSTLYSNYYSVIASTPTTVRQLAKAFGHLDYY